MQKLRNIYSTINEIIKELSNDENLSHIDFVSCCPKGERQLNRAYAMLEFNGVDISNKEYNVGIELHIPEDTEMKDANIFFSRICNCLTCGENNYNIKGVLFKGIDYDESNKVYVLKGKVRLGMIQPRINTGRYDNMIIKKII